MDVPLSVQQKRHRRDLASKEKRKTKRRSQQGQPRKYQGILSERRKASQIKAPSKFSLIENTENFLDFIKKIKRDLRRGKAIFINMLDVKKITCGSISMLLSVMSEYGNTKIHGNKPSSKEARDVLERSGFFDYVYGNIDPTNCGTLDTIVSKGLHTVEPVKTAEIIKNAMKTVSGKPQKNTKIQSLLIEMMANTVNHASLRENKLPWWLSTRHDKNDKVVSFSFIDNGVGIIKTLKTNWLQKIKKLVFSDDLDMLESAYEGKIGSRTGLDYRGRGLPRILSVAKSGHVSNFIVVSNGVLYKCGEKGSRSLKADFDGTFYYFELRKENIT